MKPENSSTLNPIEKSTSKPTLSSPPTPVPSLSPSKPLSIADLVAKISPAVVQIVTDEGSGSGIVIDTAGHILTNNHVVEKTSSATIIFKNGRKIEGRLVNTDVTLDLAILKVDNGDLSIAILGDSGKTQLGEEVLALGFPSGLGGTPTLTKGIISAFRSPYLQTDAAVNPGSSGGPLVNMYGEVIGIVTFKPRLAEGKPAEGIGFAISINEIKKVLPELLSLSSKRLSNLSIVPLMTKLGAGTPADIVVDRNNNVHVIWTESYSRTKSDHRVVYSVRNHSGSWSKAQDVCSSLNAEGATIAVDHIGTVHVVCEPEIYPYPPIYVAYANKPINSDWTAPVNIFSGREEFFPFKSVVDNEGTLHLIWVDRSSSLDYLRYSVKYTRRSASGSWSEPVVIPDVHPTSPLWDNMVLSVDSEGTLHLARLLVNVYLSVKPFGKPWASPERVSSTFMSNRSAAIAIGNNGEIHVAWAEGLARVVYSLRMSDGTWSRPTYLSITKKPVDNVKLTKDNKGEVYVLWTQENDNAKGSKSLMFAKGFKDGSWTMPLVIYEQFDMVPKAIALDAEGAIHIIAHGITSSNAGIYHIFIPAITQPVN